MSKRYLIAISKKISAISGGVDLCLSTELYAKNKSFMKDFKETGEVNVTCNMLQFFKDN